ncbi:hypothetical protein CRX72_01410 [Pantoea sp. BRM17]|nr:hypothetical protein CRX72_01410 [Pantoea sp. BRM17]
MLTRVLHIDLMTAYLATSPGGLDTVAIIAAGSRVDMAFVMALQTLRLFTILLTGPALARFISRFGLTGATLQGSEIATLQVPEWLLALAYALIGWSVGLRFTRPIFLLALRTLPQMLASILGLMVLCAALGYLRVLFVATAAAVVARIGLDTSGGATGLIWFPALGHGFLLTLVVMIAGAWLGQRLRIPSGALLLPVLNDWPVVLAVLILTLAASGLSGFLLVRFSNLPGPTGAWGSSPGGASAMVAMAGDFGADVRLVAFMHASLTLGVALQLLHLPAALLLGPMITGTVMGLSGATLRIDKRLFILAQAVLGCMIAQSLSPAILTP